MRKDLTLHYSSIVITYWMGFAVLNAFASLYLLSIGYSNTAIGMLMAAASVAAAVLQPLLTSYADRPASPALRILMAILGLLLVFFGTLVLVFNHNMIVSGIFYGCAMAVLQTLQPFINALGMEALNRKKKMNFGLGRSSGSIGYAAIASAMGIIAARFGAKSVPICYIFLFLLFMVAAYTFPLDKEKASDSLEKGENKTEGTVFFSKYKRFTIVLFGCVCLYVSHILTNNYTLQIVQSKGGGSREMGIGTSIAALIEIPTMVFFSFYLKKIKCKTMLYIAGIFFTLKAFGTYLVKDITGFYCVQILQMFGWGLMTVALVYYVNEEMDAEDVVKGQGFATTAYTIGSIIGALSGGRLADSLGIDAMMLFGTIVSLMGTIIIFLAVTFCKNVKRSPAQPLQP